MLVRGVSLRLHRLDEKSRAAMFPGPFTSHLLTFITALAILADILEYPVLEESVLDRAEVRQRFLILLDQGFVLGQDLLDGSVEHPQGRLIAFGHQRRRLPNFPGKALRRLWIESELL